MTPQEITQKYFGGKGKTEEPFFPPDHILMNGAPAGDINPINLASDAGTADLQSLLRPFFPSLKVVPNSPWGSWNPDMQRLTLSGPSTAHWFEVTGYNEFNAFVTAHLLVGPLLNAFSRMNPVGALNYVIGQINFALALEPSPTMEN